MLPFHNFSTKRYLKCALIGIAINQYKSLKGNKKG